MISHSENVTTVTTVTTPTVEPAISKNDFGESPVTTQKAVTVVTKERDTQHDKSVTTKTVVTVVTNQEWQRYLSERPLPTDDPRPELHADHALWATLLPLAHGGCSWEVFGILQGLRCMGAGLVERNGRVELWRGKMAQAEYDADRAQYLAPNAAEVVAVLGRVKHG